jgi:hypothetical protein
MSDNVLGSCSKGLLRWRIDINTKLWFYLSENDKHSLIHHELAHCVLGEEHEFAKTPHFMNESIEHLSYEELKSQFINVLNKHCKK